MTKRHLHQTDSTTYCGRDATFILMTYDLAQTTCAQCRKAKAAEGVAVMATIKAAHAHRKNEEARQAKLDKQRNAAAAARAKSRARRSRAPI